MRRLKALGIVISVDGHSDSPCKFYVRYFLHCNFSGRTKYFHALLPPSFFAAPLEVLELFEVA